MKRNTHLVAAAFALVAVATPFSPSAASADLDGLPGPIDEQVTIVPEPRFVIEAISFKAIDETGVDVLGSDEIIAIWNSPNLPGARSRKFGNVDSGDTELFHELQSCIAPIDATVHRDAFEDPTTGWICESEGTVAPLRFDVELIEHDDFRMAGFCRSPASGLTAIRPCEPTDFVGNYTGFWGEAELLRMMPTQGSAQRFTVRLNNCEETCGTSNIPGGLPDYDFTFQIRRVEDGERLHRPSLG